MAGGREIGIRMGTDTGVQLQSGWTFRKSEYFHKIVAKKPLKHSLTLITLSRN